MISFAAPGGSVGPHVDQYDVFLLQADGHRRWQIATDFDPAPAADLPLDMLANFRAQQEWLLGPGDMLYLPPGVAHHGVAEDACLTYSIGLRAPSAADLLLALGEWLADQPGQGRRYTDPGIGPAARAGELDAVAQQRMRQLLLDLLQEDRGWQEFSGQFVSRYRLAHDPAPPARATGEAALRKALARGAQLRRHPWTRMCWLEAGGQARLYAAGLPVDCRPQLAAALCGRQPADLQPALLDSSDLAALCTLLKHGHLLLEKHPEQG
jgi:50S ribosomal protein L16 3-hydroxylase